MPRANSLVPGINPPPPGCLRMTEVRVNEASLSTLTTHSSGENSMDCHVEFTIFDTLPQPRYYKACDRLLNNFRFVDEENNLVPCKEELVGPSSRVEKTISFTRSDVKVTISQVSRSLSLDQTWEIGVGSEAMERALHNAFPSIGGSSSELTAALRDCLDVVDEIRSHLQGEHVGWGKLAQNGQGSLKRTGSGLNAKAQPFEPANEENRIRPKFNVHVAPFEPSPVLTHATLALNLLNLNQLSNNTPGQVKNRRRMSLTA